VICMHAKFEVSSSNHFRDMEGRDGNRTEPERTELEPSFLKEPNRTQRMRDLSHLYRFAYAPPPKKNWFVFLGSRHPSNNYCYCYCPKKICIHAGF